MNKETAGVTFGEWAATIAAAVDELSARVAELERRLGPEEPAVPTHEAEACGTQGRIE